MALTGASNSWFRSVGGRAGPRPAGAARRVLYLVNGEHYSGAERVQDLLASRLPEFGFEVEFACVKRGKFAKMREAQGTVLHEVPMRSRLDVTISSTGSFVQQLSLARTHAVHGRVGSDRVGHFSRAADLPCPQSGVPGFEL